jgi:hypothetical protein
MQAIVQITAPFFALVLLGWLAAWRGLLPAGAVPGLNAYVLFFALPCMLLRFGMRTPVLDLLNPTVLGLYTLCAVLVVALTVAVLLRRGVGLKDASFSALVAAFPNSGFIGVPLLVALLGHAAAGPVICSLLADFFVTSSLCIGLSQWREPHAPGQHGVRQAMLRALRSALSNPLPWAITLGAAMSAGRITLVGPAEAITRMLGDSASPVALFTVGAMLWTSGQKPQPRSGGPNVVLVALIKLLAHPLLVLGLGSLAQQAGAPLTAFQLLALVLSAALPSASNVSLLTERYGADSGGVARIILSTTALAFLSFSAWAYVMGARP